jgi:hypothetical protein
MRHISRFWISLYHRWPMLLDLLWTFAVILAILGTHWVDTGTFAAFPAAVHVPVKSVAATPTSWGVMTPDFVLFTAWGDDGAGQHGDQVIRMQGVTPHLAGTYEQFDAPPWPTGQVHISFTVALTPNETIPHCVTTTGIGTIAGTTLSMTFTSSVPAFPAHLTLLPLDYGRYLAAEARMQDRPDWQPVPLIDHPILCVSSPM